MVMPGFATHPSRMRYLARQLEKAGHKTKRWGLGFNLGPTEKNIDFLEARLEEIHERYGQEVILLGWSLGGLFARELAHRRPELVAKVITMGSPFSGDPRPITRGAYISLLPVIVWTSHPRKPISRLSLRWKRLLSGARAMALSPREARVGEPKSAIRRLPCAVPIWGSLMRQKLSRRFSKRFLDQYRKILTRR